MKEVQSQLQLLGKFKATRDYMRPCLKTTKICAFIEGILSRQDLTHTTFFCAFITFRFGFAVL